ncbi:hypothetical protein V6U80_20490 [Micromonospora sp. CPCC 205543]
MLEGEDLGGHLPDHHGGGTLPGQGDGLLPGGGDQCLGDRDGVLDMPAAEQGGDAVDAGVPDRGRGLPAGEDHHRAFAVQVHSPFQRGLMPVSSSCSRKRARPHRAGHSTLPTKINRSHIAGCAPKLGEQGSG